MATPHGSVPSLPLPRRRHRSLAAVFALAAVLVSGCEYATYNIGNGANRRGDLDIRFMVSGGWRPIFLALQEVCQLRYNEMLVTLAQYGYRGRFDSTGPGCGGSGPGFGNAIFHLGDATNTNFLQYTRQEGHIRRAMGIEIKLGDFRYWGWVTHLEPNNCPVAGDQAHQLFQTVRLIQAGTGLPAVVGGDFNLQPNEVCNGRAPMSEWRATFRDAGEGLGSTHENGRKIDYMFSSFGWHAARVERNLTSDHHMVVGVVNP